MTSKIDDGGAAFPPHGAADGHRDYRPGLTKREYFAAAALANPALCTGSAPEYMLKAWFGERIALTQQEIAARQAVAYADALIAASKEADHA